MQDSLYTTSLVHFLEEAGFQIKQDIAYRRHTFEYVAKRNKLRKLAAAFEEIFVIIKHFTSLEIEDIYGFSADCRRYAKRHRVIPYFPMTGGVICYPVILSQDIDQNTVQSLLETNPKLGIGYTEIPAIVDLSAKKIWFSKKTPWPGQLALPYAREILTDLLNR